MNKNLQVIIKAVEGEEKDYHFEGYCSTYGNIDRHGDIMEKGALLKTLEDNNVRPLCLNHDMNKIVGKVELSESDEGPYVKGTFNMNDAEAVKAYDLVKMGALTRMSIGFLVNDFEPIDKDNPYGKMKYTDIDLLEVSLVTVPANDKARITDVKSFGVDMKSLVDQVSDAVIEKMEIRDMIKNLDKIIKE